MLVYVRVCIVYVYGCVSCVYLCSLVDAHVFVSISVVQETGVIFTEDPNPIWIHVRRVPIDWRFEDQLTG